MSAGGLGRREPCVQCGLPVFLAQRLLVGGRLFHRTCFTCARCRHQLSLAACYETEVDGQYCCEVCPDEDSDPTDDLLMDTSCEALSDENKEKSLQKYNDALKAESSAFNISTKENSDTTASSKALSSFLSSQFVADDDDDDVVPALPTSLPPDFATLKDSENVVMSSSISKTTVVSNEENNIISATSPSVSIFSASDTVTPEKTDIVNLGSDVSVKKKLFEASSPEGDDKLSIPKCVNIFEKIEIILPASSSSVDVESHQVPEKNDEDVDKIEINVNIEESYVNQLDTASDLKVDNDSNSRSALENIRVSATVEDVIAKDNQMSAKSDNFDVKKTDGADDPLSASSRSLVKMRMKLFETASPETIRRSDLRVDALSSPKNSNDQNNLNLSQDKISVKVDGTAKVSSDEASDKIVQEDVDAAAMDVSETPEERIIDVNVEEESLNSDSQVPCDEKLPSYDSTKPEVVDVADHQLTSENIDDILLTASSTDTEPLKFEEITDDIMNKDSTDIDKINVNLTDKDIKNVEENIEIVINKDPNDVEDITEPIETVSTIVVNDTLEDVKPYSPTVEKRESDSSLPDKNITPVDANPFGDDDDEEEYPVDLNPFSDGDGELDDTPTLIGKPQPKKISSNPFGSESEDEIEEQPKIVPIRKMSGQKPPRPPPPAILINKQMESKKRLIPAAGVSLNPFSSGDDDSEDEEPIKNPVPTPRHRINDVQEPSPIPRTSLGSGPPSFHGSTSSLASTISRRKKALAPKPPGSGIFGTPVAAPRKISEPEMSDSQDMSMLSTLSTPNTSISASSPQISPRTRKRRPAPQPPVASSTLLDTGLDSTQPTSLPFASPITTHTSSLISLPPILSQSNTDLNKHKKVISAAEFDYDPDMTTSTWESGKSEKEEQNKSQQSIISESLSPFNPDKSSSGQWKRRKGPAPAVPLLQRRVALPPMAPAALRRELQLLEVQQRGLERQGVRLEELIRERCEGPPGSVTEEPLEPGPPDPETDELVLQLFELVNEKNELFRRQAELMYIRRQQRLEEEHADLEHQIRCLMARPEANKTDSDKAREEQLLQRLLEVVERRDEVVTSLELDRLREREEDKSIMESMASHRARRDDKITVSSVDSPGKEKKEKKKDKKRWIKREKKKKSVDEDSGKSEETENTPKKKDKKHAKWFH